VNNPVRLLLKVPVPWVFVLSYLVGFVLQVRLRPSRTLPIRIENEVKLFVFPLGA